MDLKKLQPWQRDLLDKMSNYKNQSFIQSTGRQTGKTTANQAFMRLWNDIHHRPVEDLKLSEGTVYGSQYYTVEPVGGSWMEMEMWAIQTYGETGSIWRETKNLTPEPLQRWYMNDRRFWFRDEKDRLMFVLKWS
jgi:hypothetical protein